MTNIKIKAINAANETEFNQICAIRRSVFQIEQGVEPELDFDGLDKTSEQIVAYLDEQAVGTARIRYLDNKTAKIERLAVLALARGQGLGKQIMETALELAAKNSMEEVVIYAQEYVKELYQKIGFEPEGEIFEEAGIPHVKMRKKIK